MEKSSYGFEGKLYFTMRCNIKGSKNYSFPELEFKISISCHILFSLNLIKLLREHFTGIVNLRVTVWMDENFDVSLKKETKLALMHHEKIASCENCWLLLVQSESDLFSTKTFSCSFSTTTYFAQPSRLSWLFKPRLWNKE